MSKVVMRVPAERGGWSAPEDLQARRRSVAAAVASGSWRADPPPDELSLNGVRALRYGRSLGQLTVVHFHGGGFRQGCPEMVGPYAASLAERCDVEVVCPAYRLAPEHPFPAALNDGMGVVRSLAPQRQAPSLIIAGDSAGGGLALGVALQCLQEHIQIAGLILLSPWLDLTVASDSYERNHASDPVFSRAAAMEAAEQYLQGWSALDPLASPLFADLAQLPPTFISVGEGEVLADDALLLYEAVQSCGGAADLSVIANMEHTAVVRGAKLVGSPQTFAAIGAFIERLKLEL